MPRGTPTLFPVDLRLSISRAQCLLHVDFLAPLYPLDNFPKLANAQGRLSHVSVEGVSQGDLLDRHGADKQKHDNEECGWIPLPASRAPRRAILLAKRFRHERLPEGCVCDRCRTRAGVPKLSARDSCGECKPSRTSSCYHQPLHYHFRVSLADVVSPNVVRGKSHRIWGSRPVFQKMHDARAIPWPASGCPRQPPIFKRLESVIAQRSRY